MRVTTLSGFGSVENSQRTDLLSDDVSIKTTWRTFEIGSYTSNEVHTTTSATCRKVLKDFKAGRFKGSRAGSHSPCLGILPSGCGVISLFVKYTIAR